VKESTFAPKSKPLIEQGFCFQFSEVGDHPQEE
jgi:hypothetical protein